MAVPAALYCDVREAERHTVALDGTLRDPDLKPIDIFVEDLSRTGFRIPAEVGLEPRDTVSLGLAGVGIRPARIVRRDAGWLGCAFLTPLGEDQLAAALSVTPPQVVKLGTADRYRLPTTRGQAAVRRASLALRLLTVIMLAAAGWIALIGARIILAD